MQRKGLEKSVKRNAKMLHLVAQSQAAALVLRFHVFGTIVGIYWKGFIQYKAIMFERWHTQLYGEYS